MTQINLLPWREQKREHEKKLFIAALSASGVLAVLVVFLLYYYATSLIANQEKRNALLSSEIVKFDRQIKEIKELKLVRASLISRMMIVQSLQSTRALTVHLFDELIKVMPQGVHVTKVERNGNIITVFGLADSHTLISDLMRNIESDEWISNPSLTVIKSGQKEQANENEFKLNFILNDDNQVTN